MQTQDIYKEEPNLCFKIWHILTTVLFSLFVMLYVGYEFEVFKINTVVDSVHPGAGNCYAPNSPTWDNCDEFKFAYENPGIAADGMPYKNVTAEYHAICVGAMTLAVIHFISVFFHCFPCTMKHAHKFQVLLHIATMGCAIAASVKIYSDASHSCGRCIHTN